MSKRKTREKNDGNLVFSLTIKVKRRKIMKRITLLFVAALMMGTTSFAGEKNVSVNSGVWDWNVNAGRLTECLDLSSSQYDEVAMACEYFSAKLLKAAHSQDESSRSELIRNAVLGNLKLMKSALDKQQYKKYVTLLNLTLHNKGLNVYLD